MKATWLIATVLVALSVPACQIAKPASAAHDARPSASANAKPDFEADIEPILKAHCQPCHFQGGKVYDQLPFDKADTIRRLGTRLFTRIKDEKEQRLIREFLAQ